MAVDSYIAGCLFGTAIGDALGAETEFMTMESIRRRFPPNGPLEPSGAPSRVTDDTQMMLAVGEALMHAPRPYEPETLAEQFREYFVRWYNDPENNRAPGHTCLAACELMDEGTAWSEAGSVSSKGCGANMRVMPVGLLDVDAESRAGIAQLQSVLTHAHSTALAAADLTAYTIADLRGGGQPATLLERLYDYAHSQHRVYQKTWLGDIWQRAYMMRAAEDFMAYGWGECRDILDRVDEALIVGDRDRDPCLATGAGWVAEEAFGTALLCFLLFPDDPVATVRRGAFSSGDSDSIAAIAGAFAGAHHGLDAWPADWIARIEYRERIEALADWLSN
jgi:ADP-ribosylglycohydrolase